MLILFVLGLSLEPAYTKKHFFFFVAYELDQSVRVFVIAKTFRPSIM